MVDAYPHIQQAKRRKPNLTEEQISEQRKRADDALNRMNDIHSQYQISNGDYLYTLMLFIAEPIKWINKYEWRVLDEREINVGELGNLSKVQIIKSRERRLYIVSGTTLELK